MHFGQHSRRGCGLAVLFTVASMICGSDAASAMSAGPALSDASARLRAGLLHKVIVVCRVYTTGNVRHTEYCEDGYTCQPGNKCAPGPEILRQREAKRQAERQQAARQEYKSSAVRRTEENRIVTSRATTYSYSTSTTTTTTTSTATAATTSSTDSGGGNCVLSGAAGYACVYYNWDGDPKEIPTPRYRSGGGASTIGRGVRANRISQRLRQNNHVPPNVADQIGNLLALWQDLQPGDPNRQNIMDQVQQLSKCCDIPIDPGAYGGKKGQCGIPDVTMKGGLTPLQLQWTPWDLPQRAIDTKVCTPGDGLDDCVDQHYGELVMDVEPGIASACRQQEINTPAAQYGDALNACARNKFDNAWTYLAGLTFMWQSASELDPDHQCSDTARGNHDKLRDMLRRALANAKNNNSKNGPPPPSKEGDSTPKPDDVKDVLVKLPDQPSAANPDDDVLCAYLARWAVRGKLTINSGTEVPEQCKPYFDVAKDCANNSCQLATIIDNEEQRKAQQPQPWGADDRQAVDDLMKAFSNGVP
jgi:hypothetical protein